MSCRGSEGGKCTFFNLNVLVYFRDEHVKARFSQHLDRCYGLNLKNRLKTLRFKEIPHKEERRVKRNNIQEVLFCRRNKKQKQLGIKDTSR